MHDWILVKIEYDWKSRECELLLKDCNSDLQKVTAINVSQIHIPHLESWGPSNSINRVLGPNQNNGAKLVEIEMQSGDIITIEASQFNF